MAVVESVSSGGIIFIIVESRMDSVTLFFRLKR